MSIGLDDAPSPKLQDIEALQLGQRDRIELFERPCIIEAIAWRRSL
jgi:hypothetical protein